MELSKLLKNINFKGNHDNRNISSITYDSRKVKQNCLFIAINGQNCDGHDFIDDAINKGATAILANGRAPISN